MSVIFDHEKLDVYQVGLDFCVWTYAIVRPLKGDFFDARSQLVRAANSIVLNIAEGCGRTSVAERRHFFFISRGSSFESAAVLDILHKTAHLSVEELAHGKTLLQRIVAMLTRLSRIQS
jgi:four helix bundle protein